MSTENESKSLNVDSFRLVQLKHEALKQGISSSFYLSNGLQSKESLDKVIKSLWGLTNPLLSVTGLAEVISTPKGDIEGPMIPLELLELTNTLIDEKKSYRPLFFTPQLSEEEGASEAFARHFSDLEVHDQASAAMEPQPASGAIQQQQDVVQDGAANATQQFQAPDPWQNWEYFFQYGKLNIHHDMLKDDYRTLTYKEAVMRNSVDIKGKVVMDLGCGTGILSFFCAKAGAAKVYAIEASDLADWTELVVASNGLSDTIKVVKGRVEELNLPEQVDIIISEWMGTFLIFESMMESLLYARNAMLKPGGLMLPSLARIFLCPVTMNEYYNGKVDFWKSVYDVDMSVLIPFAKKCAFEKPIIDHPLKPENVLAEPLVLRDFDLSTVSVDEPYEKTTTEFEFKASKTAIMHGFASWFDVTFNGTASESLLLSTDPSQKETHWKQMLLLFDAPVEVKEGWTIKGTIRSQRNPELLRHLIIDVSYSVVELPNHSHFKKFFLWGSE